MGELLFSLIPSVDYTSISPYMDGNDNAFLDFEDLGLGLKMLKVWVQRRHETELVKP